MFMDEFNNGAGTDSKNAGERFNYAVDVVLSHEIINKNDTISDDKNDPGGITNWGISLRWLRSVGEDIDKDGDIDADDIRAINDDISEALLKKYWWDKYNYNAINNLTTATKVFDLAVNMGAIPAHKLLQQAVNMQLDRQQLIVDGIIGKNTLTALNSISNRQLLFLYRNCAADYYRDITRRKPEMNKFLKGWLKRASW